MYKGDQIKGDGIGRACARTGAKRMGNEYRIWQDNIKMGLKEIEWDTVDWINLTKDKDEWYAVVNTVLNLQVPQDGGNFLTS